ncbi:SDR family oxidoreductase [Mycolicibacterium smegmatis]|uniref:SDR family oxidoreductase n=1 Tax=Mycolicibacterium smegmatis TaxID=1772 RepID=UPI0022B7FEE5|nr:SDR family oxidoreductase [Mycolicibacterium smegmatis]
MTCGRRRPPRTPLGRAAQPSEMAAAAPFLASDEDSFTTGIDLLIDSGLPLVGTLRSTLRKGVLGERRSATRSGACRRLRPRRQKRGAHLRRAARRTRRVDSPVQTAGRGAAPAACPTR